MAVGNVFPNGDGVCLWRSTEGVGNHWQGVDEDPIFPLVGDYSYATEANGDDNDTEYFHMTTVAIGGDSVSQVVVWTYGMAMGAAPEVRIWNGVGWEAYQDTGLIIADDWVSNTFAVDMSNAELAVLAVQYKADVPLKLGENMVYCLYAVITYGPVGYGHNFMGVPAANIGSVNGVPTANIASIKGV